MPRRALAAAVLMLWSMTATMADTTLPLVPAPRSVVPAEGSFAVYADTALLIDAAYADKLRPRLVILTDLLAAAGWQGDVVAADGPRPGAVFVGLLPGAAAESYTVDIMPDGAVLRGGSPDGVTWALQTVRQLLPAGLETPLPRPADDPGRPDGRLYRLPDGFTHPANSLRPEPVAPERSGPAWTGALPLALPCLRLADAPRFGWRGLLLDCGRHFMDLATIERVIDLMSLHKLNRLHWHLTEDQGWRLAIASRPKLAEIAAWRRDMDGARYGGCYSRADAEHVVAYAAARGITVVPEIEMPGHSQAALAAYPELGCRDEPVQVQDAWGVWPDVYCAGNEAVFAFLEDVLTEVLDIFPSEFIHVGGDECPKDRWRECPRCQQRIADEGLKDEHELQSWFIRRIDGWLDARGRRLIGWDEILEGGLAPGATVQSWRGYDGAVAAARQGHDTVVSPTSHAYFDYDLATTDLAEVYAYDPVSAELSDDEARHVLGGEMNLWTEYIPQAALDERIFPRACAMAEVLWAPAAPDAAEAGHDVRDPAAVGRDFSGFWTRLTAHYARLDRLGVRRSAEGRPVTMTTAWDADADRWQVSWTCDRRLPAGEAVVRVTGADGAVVAEGGLDGSFAWSDGGVLEATLTVGGRPFGAPWRLALASSLALEAPVTVSPATSPRYEPRVPMPVTDGVLPDGDYRDGRWLAWEGPDAEVVLDMGRVVPVRSVTGVFLHAGAAIIFSPERMDVAVSADGEAWTDLGAAPWRLPADIMMRVMCRYEVAADAPTDARYVRVRAAQRRERPDWDWARRYDPWIFLGQVVVR